MASSVTVTATSAASVVTSARCRVSTSDVVNLISSPSSSHCHRHNIATAAAIGLLTMMIRTTDAGHNYRPKVGHHSSFVLHRANYVRSLSLWTVVLLTSAGISLSQGLGPERVLKIVILACSEIVDFECVRVCCSVCVLYVRVCCVLEPPAVKIPFRHRCRRKKLRRQSKINERRRRRIFVECRLYLFNQSFSNVRTYIVATTVEIGGDWSSDF